MAPSVPSFAIRRTRQLPLRGQPMLDDGPHLFSLPPTILVDMPSELATAEMAAKGPTTTCYEDVRLSAKHSVLHSKTERLRTGLPQSEKATTTTRFGACAWEGVNEHWSSA